MDEGSLVDALAAVPHFAALERRVLERMAACSRRVRLVAGERLFGAGEPARCFYAVRRGAVRAWRSTVDGREQVMHHLRPGQSFAEVAAFQLGRYPVNAEARATPTEVIAIAAEPFLILLAEEPAVAGALIGALTQRLAALIERIEELSLVSADARLARHLLRLPARPEGPGSRSFRIELALAKRELAQELGITPETLSRTLRRWREQGIVSSQGRVIRIHDADRLEAVAGQAPDLSGTA